MSQPVWKVWNFGREGKVAICSIGPAFRKSLRAESAEGCARLRDSERQNHRVAVFRLAKSTTEGEHHLRRPNQGPSSKQGGGNGTRRQKSPRSTVHCAGGPFPKRKNDTVGSDTGADRRDPARRKRRRGNVGRRSHS